MIDALLNLKSNPLRSFLTMLGVIIGVFSVVTLVSIGEGARRYVTDQFSKLGSNVLIVTPGGFKTSGGPTMPTDSANKLTVDDARALRRCPSVLTTAPIIVAPASLKIENRFREKSMVVGTTAEFSIVRSITAEIGQFLPDSEAQTGKDVCVIGRTVLRELWPDGRLPLGEWIRIENTPFRVIGILEDKGFGMGFDFNDLVIVPVHAAEKLFNTDRLVEIAIKTLSEDRIPDAKLEIEETMKRRHNDRVDFTLQDQAQMLEAFGKILNVLTLAIGGIAAISLLVGGIGIMNIMLVSVGEKTREIGVRKAVGATRRDIMVQFLIESVTVSGLGGAIGAGLGAALALLLHAAVPSFPVAIQPWTIGIALGFAVCVGVFFGVYPARKAANLDPIEALRYE